MARRQNSIAAPSRASDSSWKARPAMGCTISLEEEQTLLSAWTADKSVCPTEVRSRTMSERNLRIRIGIFVVMTLVLLAALILMFGSLPVFFKNTHTFTIIFDDAPGVS